MWVQQVDVRPPRRNACRARRVIARVPEHTMTSHRHHLPPRAHLRRTALWLALALSAGSLSAQTPAADPDDKTLKLEKFEVTGSYLPVSADAPAIPVTVIDAAAIAKTGVTTSLLDVLKKTAPQFTGSRNLGNNNANIGGGSTNGGAQLAFRNLPTLVLINGRRAAFAPVSASGGYEFVDVNLIPVAAVERVELLADGASAIYGSDAVSGVVNIILKSNYEGLEVGGHYGFSDNGGHYTERSAHAVGGMSNGKTSITVSAEWSRSDPLYQYERSFSSPLYGTPTYAGVINIGSNYYLLNPSLSAAPSGHTAIADLVANGTYLGPYTSTQIQQYFDLSSAVTLLQEFTRKSGTAAFEHKFNDRVTLFGDVLYASTQTFYQLNAQPFAASLSSTNAGNPTTSTITARNRLIDYPRQYYSDTQSLRGVVGLKGTLANDYSWETALNHNEVRQNYRNANLIDSTARAAAVADGSLVLTSRDISDAVAESILGTAYANYVSKLTTFDAVVRGQAFELPAGPVDFAVAVQVQKEQLAVNADRNSQAATFNWDSATTINPFANSRKVESGVLQAAFPLVSAAQNLPFAHSLVFDAAVRYSKYSDTDDPTVPKYTLRWQPFDDQLTLRSTYSQSFKAPTLYDLFGPVDIGFTSSYTYARYDSAGNALGSTVSGQANYRSGSNSALKPSESDNFTAGFVWAPKAIQGLSVTADYFRIAQYDVVSSIGAYTILESVERLGAASPYAQFVRLGTYGDNRGFDAGTAITAPGQVSAAGLDNVFVTDQSINIGGYKMDGVDLGVRYTWEWAGVGRFEAATNAAIYNHVKIRTLFDTPYEEYSNTVTGNFGQYPDWRTYTTLSYQRGDLTATLGHTFIPSLYDPSGSTAEDRYVECYNSWDINASYAFGPRSKFLNGLKLTLGVNNVLNEFGPRSPSNTQSNVDISTYGAVGRLIYGEFSIKF